MYPNKTATEKLLQEFPVLPQDPKAFAPILAPLPFEVLKGALERAAIPLPKQYAAAKEELDRLQLWSGDPKRQRERYAVGKGAARRDLTFEEYRQHLRGVLATYSEEAFYKQQLTAGIRGLLFALNDSCDLIEENKGLDDHWVRQEVSLQRARAWAARKTLRALFSVLTALVQKQPSVQPGCS